MGYHLPRHAAVREIREAMELARLDHVIAGLRFELAAAHDANGRAMLRIETLERHNDLLRSRR